MSTNTTRQKVKALEREVDTLKTTVINLERFANNTVGHKVGAEDANPPAEPAVYPGRAGAHRPCCLCAI